MDKKIKREKEYKVIRDDLRTADIVLFSGVGFVSNVIKLITNSKWTHVGMIIKLINPDIILLWQSTSLSKIKDFETKEIKKGVQLVCLSEVVKDYTGEIAIRHLDGAANGSMLFDLMLFRDEIKRRPYEQNAIELFKSAYDGLLGNNIEDLKSLFCSELIAEAYQRLLLLPENIPSNEYTPADFSSERKINMMKGNLSEEIYIKK